MPDQHGGKGKPKPVSKRHRATMKRLHEQPVETSGPSIIDAEHRDGRLIVRITPICPAIGQNDLTAVPPAG